MKHVFKSWTRSPNDTNIRLSSSCIRRLRPQYERRSKLNCPPTETTRNLETKKMFYIFHVLQPDMVFEIVNPFSWKVNAISSEKKLPIVRKVKISRLLNTDWSIQIYRAPYDLMHELIFHPKSHLQSRSLESCCKRVPPINRSRKSSRVGHI